jgi:Hemerythrin HHE cation binding domain
MGGGAVNPLASDGSLEAVRRRRAELRESLGRLEQALAAPAPQRTDAWAAGVSAALAGLSEDFHTHIAVTEGPDGLYQGVLASSPRLAHAVATLQDEHGDIGACIDDLRTCVDGASDPEGVSQVRELGVSLLARCLRHRQRGADLVYQAYEADIGGET